MALRYMTDDGSVFKTEEAASAYQRDCERDENLRADASRFLDMQDWPADEKSSKRERTKAEKWIFAWLAHDSRRRPARYAIDEEAEVVELVEAS